jgi:hypothetical protein
MKKTAISILACLFTFCFTNADAQITHTYVSNHPHHHLSQGVASIIYDPFGTGKIQEEVYMDVSNSDHPECTIVRTSIYVTIETANDHWTMLDISGTSNALAGSVTYNMNDEPYWISYDWEVEYSDGTWESEVLDYYY